MTMLPSTAMEWFGLIVFIISTPAFIWFVIHELNKRDHKKQLNENYN